MGRIKRQRNRRKIRAGSEYSLNHDLSIIKLKQWMTGQGWTNNPTLYLKHFPDTGRGVYGKSDLRKKDVLIEVPLPLIITYITLNQSDLTDIFSGTNAKANIQDMLAMFLAVEMHKKSGSSWKVYIDSLPNLDDFPKLIMLTGEEIFDRLPKRLQNIVMKSRQRFVTSWNMVYLLLTDWKCSCCGSKGTVTKDMYSWAYVIVNTRAVYLDFNKVRHNLQQPSPFPLDQYLSDEPSMALCPFLDMFNHSSVATTRASVQLTEDPKGMNYRLETLNSFKRYHQIFINYGAHDSKNLWSEYGFTIGSNPFDAVEFAFDEILLTSQLKADEHQYGFIKKHALDADLSSSSQGMSFNLKAVLYVLMNESKRCVWASAVFSDSYDNSALNEMNRVCCKLLKSKEIDYKRDLEVIELLCTENKDLKTAKEYCQSQLNLLESAHGSLSCAC